MLVRILQLGLLVAATEAVKYLTEKPDFLTPCPLDSSSFNQCFSKNLQNVYVKWKDGLPGTNILGSFEPIFLKRLTIRQANPNSIIQFMADMRNVYISGSSRLTVKRAKYYPKRNVIKALIIIPKLSYDVDYKVKGHFYGLHINSQGDGQFEAENVVMLYEFFINHRITPEATFADVQDLKVTLRDTGNFTIQLNNLFKGNEELEKTTNMLFNQNWRPVYEIIRPAVEEAVETVMLDRSKKAFNYVPAKYLFRNFH